MEIFTIFFTLIFIGPPVCLSSFEILDKLSTKIDRIKNENIALIVQIWLSAIVACIDIAILALSIQFILWVLK